MCTAFSYCRDHQQRLQAEGSYAPNASGGSGSGPQALRPARLQWLSNISSGSQIAAFRKCRGPNPATSRAFRPLSFQNSDWCKAWQKHFPPVFAKPEGGVSLT